MIDIKYNTWDKLKLGKYIQLMKLASSDDSTIDTVIKQLSILCDCDEQDILELSLDRFAELKSKTSFLMEAPEPSINIPEKIRLNGTRYKVITDVSKLNTAQYIDLQSYTEMYNKDVKYLPYLLSVFIINKKYGNNTDKTIEDITNYMSTRTALQLSNFFLVSFLVLISNIENSLTQEMKTLTRNEKKTRKRRKKANPTILLPSGDGSI